MYIPVSPGGILHAGHVSQPNLFIAGPTCSLAISTGAKTGSVGRLLPFDYTVAYLVAPRKREPASRIVSPSGVLIIASVPIARNRIARRAERPGQRSAALRLGWIECIKLDRKRQSAAMPDARSAAALRHPDELNHP